MLRSFILLLYAYTSLGYGYDSGGDQSACGRPYRAGRMHQPPCDVATKGFCAAPGSAYPWHAVRRFVRDNQGLMRRMYGDQRHGHVLQTELQQDADPWDPLHEWQPPSNRPRYARFQHEDDISNELNDDLEVELEQGRFLRDDLDVKNDEFHKTKFVYSEELGIAIKLAGLKTGPHFRPTTQSTTQSKEVEEQEVTESTQESTTDTTTDQTTTTSGNIDRIGEEEQFTTTSSESGTADGTKEEAVLFQDMAEEDDKKKPDVNYNKLRGVNACPVKEEVVAPFWANNTRGEVLALLNLYPFEQYVHWEKCTFEHRQMYCREGCRCEQQYRLHRLLAYDPNNECRGIFSDWFRFPSCCVCKCYDMPPEFRVTSRSPRFQQNFPDV